MKQISKKHILDKRGFTLVEMIVVIVILAVLTAAVVFSLIGWTHKARESAAISEAGTAVTAAQSEATQLYADGMLSSTVLTQSIASMETLAGIPSGSILEVIANANAQIVFLDYHASNGLYVTYENGTYTVSEQAKISGTVQGYLRKSAEIYQTLLDHPGSTTVPIWTRLWNAYQEAYNGSYPKISEQEKTILSQISDQQKSDLSWKPMITAKNDILMIASTDVSSTRNAYLIYYNGKYYYHKNGTSSNSHQDACYVDDQGRFDPETELAKPQWVAVEP